MKSHIKMFRNENELKKMWVIYILKRILLFTQGGQLFVEDFEHQNHTQQKLPPVKIKRPQRSLDAECNQTMKSFQEGMILLMGYIYILINKVKKIESQSRVHINNQKWVV
jgi:hypothetical protein